MAFVTVAVRLGMSGVAVSVAVVGTVAVLPHPYYVTRMGVWMQPHRAVVGGLVGQFDTEALLRD